MENATGQQAPQAQPETTYRAGKLAEMYASYAAKVIPDDAPSFQRRDMKQSYLAGGVAFNMCMLDAMREAGRDDQKLQTLLDVLEKELQTMVGEITSPEFIAKALADDMHDVRAALAAQDGEDGEDAIRIATTASGLNEDEAKDLARAIALWIAEATDKRRAAANEATPTVQ
jgi:hypothetical protein